jgi:hypothetical protein
MGLLLFLIAPTLRIFPQRNQLFSSFCRSSKLFCAFPIAGGIKANDSYKVQHVAIKGYLDTLVPIPLRIYSRKDTQPLAGLRFGSKDIFPVTGVRITRGPEACFSVHIASERTCVILQKLIDLDAVFVSRTKTFAFSSVNISIDYLFPVSNIQAPSSGTFNS